MIVSAESQETRQAAIDRAAELLRGGGTVAFPTDTVYGVGADPFNEAAIRDLYTAKGRPDRKPLALLVASIEEVARLSPNIPPAAARAMEAFWPGPLTLVIEANPVLPSILRAGLSTVGVRMPDHPLALALIRAFGGPIATTSANRSGRPDLFTAGEVEEALGNWISLILDSGRASGRAPSTVVDVTISPPRILRPGPVDEDALASVLR